MFSKFPRCFLLARANVSVFREYETSALYVTGDKAQETYSVLVPYLDFDERFKNLEKLKENVKLRGINIDVEKLKKLWELCKTTDTNKGILERRRVEIVNKIKELQQVGTNETEAEIGKYILQGKLVRDDLKVLVKGLWGLEKQAVIRSLALPNDLDEDTPKHDARLVHEFGEKPNHGGVVQSSLVDYHDPSCYYLKNEAAVFELEIQYYFADALQKRGFVQFSNADFAWSVVVEGCGSYHRDPNVVFILEDDDPSMTNQDHRLHLVGGASLVSFCAFQAKNFIDRSSLPLKYFTLGKKYEPSRSVLGESDSGSIYDSWQASAVELFMATHDDSAAKSEFNRVLDAVTNLYEQLGYHFRVVYLPPCSLHGWETLRASFQMYLPSRESYVEVGNISVSNSYISKRLLMCYGTNKQEQNFLSLVSGTLLSVPKIIACILEYNGTETVCFPELPGTSKISV